MASVPTIFSKPTIKLRPHKRGRFTAFDDYQGSNVRLNLSREPKTKNVDDLTAMTPRARAQYERDSTINSIVAKSVNRRRKRDRMDSY